MLSASPVDDFKVQFLQLLQPPCKLAFWLLEVPQPSEGAVVSSECELPAYQVRAIEVNKGHKCEQFPPGHTVPPLGLGQEPAAIRNDSFLPLSI